MSKHLLNVVNLGKRSFTDGLKTQELIRRRVIQATTTNTSASRYDLPPCPSTTTTTSNSLLSSSNVQCSSNDSEEHEYQNVLLLMEHWPVYTCGLRDSALTPDDIRRLRGLGADVYQTNRGGLATFHGPGQLVAYPIINLKRHGFGLREYVSRLEKTLIDTCEEFGVPAKTTKDVGVWVENRKIASLGVNAKRHVTMHGVALNCNTDLAWFDHITPCGLVGVEMTSLSKETGNTINVSESICHFLHSFAYHFDCDLTSSSSYVPAHMSYPHKPQPQYGMYN